MRHHESNPITDSFIDAETGERVDVELVQVRVPGLDANIYQYRMHGPGDQFFTHQMQIAGSALRADPSAGGFASELDATREAYHEVQQLVGKGHHHDLVTQRSTEGWGEPEPPLEPLMKHSAKGN